MSEWKPTEEMISRGDAEKIRSTNLGFALSRQAGESAESQKAES